MSIRLWAAASLLAVAAMAQPVLYRADMKADRTSERYQAVLTLRYTSLEENQRPEVLWGNPISGFAPISEAKLQTTASAVIVHMSPDETDALGKMGANGQTPFLYIHALRSSGKTMADQFVEIWALKPKLTFVRIVGRLLQVQENYIPPALEKFKTDVTAWDLRDQFHREQRIESVRGIEDPGERVLTLRLASPPGERRRV